MKSMENIRNIAIGLGVMVLFPIAVDVGIRLIIKEPSWNFNELKELRRDQSKSKVYKEKVNEFDTQSKEFGRINFYVKTVLGLLAIVVGTLTPIPYLGMGFIFGGVICLSFGYLPVYLEGILVIGTILMIWSNLSL